MRSGDGCQAAILDRRLGDRQPHRHLVGIVGILEKGDDVLMPGGGADIRMARHLVTQRRRRRLHPHLLDRTGEDFRPDDVLDHIEDARMAHQLKHGRAVMHVIGVWLASLVQQRQRYVQELVQDWIFCDHPRIAFAEIEVGVAVRNFTFCMQVCRQPVEKLGIFGFDGGEVFRWHDIVDGQKAVALECDELVLGEGGGGRSGLHRAPSGGLACRGVMQPRSCCSSRSR